MRRPVPICARHASLLALIVWSLFYDDRTEGRFFYGMPESGASQWIYTHPEEGAPRTGEGIFPMEVVEVVQVCGRPDTVNFAACVDLDGCLC